jgi:hypothetical protein
MALMSLPETIAREPCQYQGVDLPEVALMGCTRGMYTVGGQQVDHKDYELVDMGATVVVGHAHGGVGPEYISTQIRMNPVEVANHY